MAVPAGGDVVHRRLLMEEGFAEMSDDVVTCFEYSLLILPNTVGRVSR